MDDEDEDVGFSQKRTGLGAPVALLNDVAQVRIASAFKLVIDISFILRVTKTMIHLLIVDDQQSQTAKMSTDKRGAA